MIKYDKIQKLILDDLYKEKNEWQVVKDDENKCVWCIYKGYIALTIPDTTFFIDIEKCNRCNISIESLYGFTRTNEKYEQVKHISYTSDKNMNITILESDNKVTYCDKRIFDIIDNKNNQYKISKPLDPIILDSSDEHCCIMPIRYTKE